MQKRIFPILFIVAALLRFLCVFPFVIDDDEAWWSASALALKTPWEFYQKAVDNKPPGTVCFYWILEHVLPLGADPRVARAVYTGLTIGAALILGWVASRLSRNQKEGWLAALLFLLISGAPSPKLLALTGDGLLSLFVIAAYGAAFVSTITGAAFIGGALLAFAILIKQTAVFFVLPILFARIPKRVDWRVFLSGLALILVPTVLAVGFRDFIYWNWTYPREVLITAREQLSFSYSDLFSNLAIFAVAIFPLFFALKKLRPSLLDFRILWLLSASWALLLGKGVFLHYFLLLIPPLALLSAEALTTYLTPSLLWLGIPYALGCALLTLPMVGIFWGSDLAYYKDVQSVLKKVMKPGEKMLLWGGSAIPLAGSRVPYISRFVLPRFVIGPYSTPKTHDLFQEEISREAPELILDLHERGDNRFDSPLESEPVLSRLIHQGYHLYVSPAIPWAKFYFKTPHLNPELVEILDPKSIYAPFPLKQHQWEKFRGLSDFFEVLDLDWRLRASNALELAIRQGATEEDRARAETLRTHLANINLNHEEILDYFKNAGYSPMPLRSMMWWPQIALVELQPRATRP